MSPTSRRRPLVAALAAFGVVLSALAAVTTAPAQADVSTKISVPYTQDWSNAALITTNDDWSGVTGVQGYLGDDGSTTDAGVNPQGLVGDTWSTTTDVVANAQASSTNGGVLEVGGDAIAIQGSGTADAPNLVFHVDLTGQDNAKFSFDARDLDGSPDDATQQIAVHYRVGTTGNYSDLPDGYIIDATTGGSATQVTHRDVSLPSAANGQADVYVRVMTTNASGNDELVGIDDISITAGGDAAPLTATAPGDKTGIVGHPITPFSLAAAGGTGAYSWEVEGLPGGTTASASGEVSGTPSVEGTFPVTATVTDSADPAATDDVTFTITVSPALSSIPIAAIQGNGNASPLVGDPVITEGVVTAAYPSGGFFGFYLQTEGTGGSVDPTTRTNSDGIFVRQTVAAGAVTVEPGDFVQVSGTVTEFADQTQVEVTSAANIEPAPGTPNPVTPVTASSWPATPAQKEALEGMLFSPQGEFTVSNTFATNQFGELGLAVGDTPLIQPTEVADAQTPAEAAVAADNAARAIILDDASSTNFLATGNAAACNPLPSGCLTNGHLTPPYISNDASIRVGATGTFDDDVILTEGGSPSDPTYRFVPVATVTGPANAGAPATFENTRTEAPDASAIDPDGTADLKIASFNVLNYFTTLGDANNDNAGDGGCTAFRDRDGDGNNVNSGCDQRGAWDPDDLERQQDKIVDAINTLDADVVGLMEIENSAKLGETPDEATEALVDALNADAGGEVWAANPSSSDLPPVADQDVITNAIIYKTGSVDRVGDARALGTLSGGSDAFHNAREPIAQAFTPDGSDAPFLVVVNHFKSKGSGVDDGTGQGRANPDRVAQAEALRDWVPSIEADLNVDASFLLGDFNAYSMEDPMQVLYDAGYTDVAPEGEYSYSFSGLSGSLDHIVADAEALAMVTGSDIWNINSGEPLPMEYSRYNYHSTDFHAPGPYRSSDHDPVVVGIDTAGSEPTTKDIQILATNDFHGRLENNPSGTEAGAAVLAGAVKQLRQQNPNTVFAAAGDLIGASTFTSFIQNDKPTIDALNEAGLEVSAVGNHELDQGYDDLVNRVMATYDEDTNPEGGAEWHYIAANLKMKTTGDPAVPATWVKSFGQVDVGFVGAVTEELPSLVSPAGIADIEVTDIVDSVNAEAADLESAGADVIVMLVHEGAPATNCATMDDAGTWADIINNVSGDVDAIVSGHTHLAYNCSFPVAGWSGRAVTERPVVSAGQYGAALNRLVFSVDTTTGEVTAKTQEILNLKTGQTPNYPADPATAQIVADAVAAAGPAGSVELGKIAGPFSRAKFGDGNRENRGGESTLGNLVAEVQRWATEAPESGGAEIAFMNPGGLRADMVGLAGDFPRTLTYRQAADVQPFANTLVNMDLTGANIKLVLEQQWQRNAAGQVPSRPFLKLGASEGFEYTYDPALPEGERVTGMTLDGVPIDPAATYSVTVNSFLASGGDNFRAFNNGTNKRDTGKIDLQAMVDYLAEFANTGAGDPPLPVDFSQRSVGASFAGGDRSVPAGESLSFDLSSLILTGSVGTTPNQIADVKDAEVKVSLDGEELGTFPVDAAIPNPGTGTGEADAASSDEAGTTAVDVGIPADTVAGAHDLVVTGATTGTEVEVPITVEEAQVVETTVAATGGPVTFGTGWSAHVVMTPATASGEVEVRQGDALLGTATLADGKADVAISGSALQPGTHTLTVRYLGDATHGTSSGTFNVTVSPPPPGATSTTVLTVNPAVAVVGQDAITLTATVSTAGTTPTGQVVFKVNGIEIGSRPVVDGSASWNIGTAPGVGTVNVTATYAGDASTAGSTSEPAQLRVVKADVRLGAAITPKPVIVKRSNTRLHITVSARGQQVTGLVRVSWRGSSETVSLRNGVATVKLGKWGSTGRRAVEVEYLGSAKANPARKVVRFTVRPKPGR